MTPASFARAVLILIVAASVADPAAAQSLFLDRGQHAAEGTIGWSFGPSSDGVETRFGVARDGRLDLGFGFNRYVTDFDDGTSSPFTEVAPYVRWFAAKESGSVPVSLSLGAQYFVDNFEGDDSGSYVMLGPTVYKRLKLSDSVTLYPFLGFSLVGESYTFGGHTDNAWYLARNVGLIFTTALDADGRSLVRFEVEEQSFRRETYRAARVGYVRRF
jgi:hypothetical protein